MAAEKYPLNPILTPLNREERLQILENWQRITRYFNTLQGQIKVLAGGEEIDEVLARIELAIANTQNATFHAQDATNNINDALSQLNILISTTNASANSADVAADEANQLNIILNRLKGELETIQTDLNGIVQAEAQREVDELERIENEDERILAENERITKESERKTNEQGRVTAESQRVTTFDAQMLTADQKITMMQYLIDNLRSYDFNANETYDFPNFIKWNGSTFIVLKEITGVTPADDGVNYRLVAQRGVDGTGAVSSVNGIAPDPNGNVQVVLELINNLVSESTTAGLTAAQGKVLKVLYDALLLTLNNHIDAVDNPHSVTAEQLALGNVQNFSVATQAEAEVGTASAKYMTPQRTQQAIDKNLTPLQEQVTTHLAQSTNQLAHTPSKYNKIHISDTFLSGENWVARKADGIPNNEWILENYKLKPNESNSDHLLWHKEKIVDGKISLTWDNPNTQNEQYVTTAIMFRGKSYKEYYAFTVYASGGNANKVLLLKINGSDLSILQTVVLSTDDVKIVNGNPINFSVSFIGKTFKCIVNGKTVSTYVSTDYGFDCGKFGIQLSNTTTNPLNLNTTLSNFSAEEIDYKIYSNNIKKILVVGDSIANQSNATVGRGWIDLFRNRVIEISPGATVENIAEGGANSNQVFNTLTAKLATNSYDMVIVSCGTNNTRIDGGSRRDIATTLNDIAKISKSIKESGAIPILCTPPNMTNRVAILDPVHYGSDSYSLMAAIVNGIIMVSNMENVRLVDNYPLFSNQFDTYLTDGVHPNDAGYALMAHNLYNTIYQ